MRDFESKLRADLARAKDDLQEAQQVVERSLFLIRYITGLLEEASGLFESTNGKSEQRSNGRDFANMTTPAVIATVLKEAGTELRVSEIVDRAIAGGYGGEKPDKRKLSRFVSSALARAVKNPAHPLFRKVSHGRFILSPNVPSL
jgi:hypothetical protein